jgi:hypothetical protein
MLEEELKKAWDNAGWINVSHSGLHSANLARNDYQISCETKESDGVYRRISTLIREHLIEALTSPYPYIREWAKLIMEEKNA